MPFDVENIRHRLHRAPMLRALLPLVVGIVLARWITLPLWSIATTFALCSAAALVWRNHTAGGWYLVAAIASLGFVANELQHIASHSPEGLARMEIEVGKIGSHYLWGTTAEGVVVAFSTDGKVHRSRTHIRLMANSPLSIGSGDRIEVQTRIDGFDPEQSYGRYMIRQGFAGQVWLTEQNILQHTPGEKSLIDRIRDKALERIQRLQLPEAEQGLTAAVSIGDRSRITHSLREDYTLSGAAHLLAVSGLHVGFVCVVMNLLLGWMVLLPKGNRWRSALVVVAIWIYAAMAGMMPSVVRAAAMFSIMQVATHLASRTQALNSLCFTAFVMLVGDARMVSDAGFLLSFVAVAAIIEWALPMARQRPSRNVVKRAGQWLYMTLVVSIAVGIATAPLVAYLFGRITLWGIVTTPLMVVMCALLVGATIVWLLLPIGLLQPLFRWVVGSTAGAMNHLSAWCAEVEWMHFEWQPSVWLCVGVYMLFAGATLLFWGRRRTNI